MQERRRWKRFDPAYPVEWDEGELALADISKGGAGLLSALPPDQNGQIVLRLFMKDRMYRFRAVTVYVKKLRDGMFRVGTRFLDLPSGFAEAFEREIEEISQYRRENKLYRNEAISFREASRKYLKLPS
ncbi:MAG: hypothetical protein GF408_06835 [Candidatus Omnitrophica bacterium]|nr:hypothetical protein [Candidatus Omnitrophota bacterium]